MTKTQNRDANNLRWQKSTCLGICVPGPEYRKMEHRETLRWGCCCKKREKHYASRRRHPSFKAEHIFHLHWPGCEFLRYVWGPEAGGTVYIYILGGTAHLQSQGEGEAANPHRPVPQGFEPWTFGSKIQYPTSELPAPSGNMQGAVCQVRHSQLSRTW